MLGVLQLACVIVGARAIFGGKRHLLRRMTLTRLLAPAYVSGMLLVLAVTPLYQAAEIRWITQDRLMTSPTQIWPNECIKLYRTRITGASATFASGSLHCGG